jgi:hypothetical protein
MQPMWWPAGRYFVRSKRPLVSSSHPPIPAHPIVADTQPRCPARLYWLYDHGGRKAANIAVCVSSLFICVFPGKSARKAFSCLGDIKGASDVRRLCLMQQNIIHDIMSLTFEPHTSLPELAMNQNTRATTTDGVEQRFIHSKLVKSPFLLTTFLRDRFGEGNYQVEVRSVHLFSKEDD